MKPSGTLPSLLPIVTDSIVSSSVCNELLIGGCSLIWHLTIQAMCLIPHSYHGVSLQSLHNYGR